MDLGPLPPTTGAAVVALRRAAGSAGRDELRDSLTAVHDWPGLLATATLHGMAGTLCGVALRDARDLLPEATAGEWADIRRGIAARSLLMSRKALEVLRQLAEAGVTAMLYKGPALSEPLYGDVAARSWGDIDLVVAERDVPAAAGVLQGVGFVPHAGGTALGAALLDAEQEIGFKQPGSGLAMDLHWRVGLRFARAALSGEELLSRAVMGEVLERPVLVPSRPDVALLTAVHAAAHNWPQLDHVLTMALALRALDGEAATLEESARRAGCARRFHVGVLLVWTLAAIAPPPSLRRAALADRPARRLAADAGAELLWRRETAAVDAAARRSRTHAREVLWQLAALDSPAAAARHAWVRLVRPGALDMGGGTPMGRPQPFGRARAVVRRQLRVWRR